MGLNDDEAANVRQQMMAGDRSDMPGMIRASFGLYNTYEDIDRLLDALTHIGNGNYKGNYTQDRASGEYSPHGWQPDFGRYFRL